MKARANQIVRRPPSVPFVAVTVAGSSTNENTTDAATNPSTNFGKRSQMTRRARPLAARPCRFRNVHQTESANAATPMSTFCENFTTTPAFIAASLMSAPAATTEPLVSSVPPSQAPPTTSGMPERTHRPRHDHHHRDGDDEHERRDVGELPLVALDRAAGGDRGRHAADRDRGREHHRELLVDLQLPGEPEAEVPDGRDHQQRLRRCRAAPAWTISRNRMLEPRMTRPVLMKYSVRTASRSHPGRPITLLMKSPIARAKMTYSSPQ